MPDPHDDSDDTGHGVVLGFFLVLLAAFITLCLMGVEFNP